jgi:hypothetical protein
MSAIFANVSQFGEAAAMSTREGKVIAMTSAVRAMLRWICRAAIGLTLAFAAATPSLAELGCFEDAVRHSQEAAASGQNVAAEPADGRDELPAQPDRAQHCSFSHCAQWVPVAPPARPSLADGFTVSAYAPFESQRLAQMVREGPERPPRA